MKFTLLAILTLILFSCNQKHQKEVKHDFPTADAAFKYFIDTTGLIQDKKDSKRYFLKSKIKANIKSIYSNSYDVYFKYGRKLYKKPKDRIVEIFNKDGQIARRYLKFYEIKETTYNKGNTILTSYIPYEKNIIHVFKYNKHKQLVIFYILLDESSKDNSKTRLAGVQEFIYFSTKEKQDSVLVDAYGFSGTYDNGSGMFGYDRAKNKIEAFFGFYFNSTLLDFTKSLYRLDKNKGYYTENYVKFKTHPL